VIQPGISFLNRKDREGLKASLFLGGLGDLCGLLAIGNCRLFLLISENYAFID
jgi:hypothetical protein